MAPPSKSRNNKRNSSTSYASTLTTLVFIALCVFGVWMLTTNSTVSPKSLITENPKTHTSLDISDDTTTSGSDESFETATTNNNNNSEESTESNTSEDSSSSSETNFNTKSQNQKETTSYGDDPGNLPDDANSQKQDTIHQLSSEESSSLLTQKQEFVSNEEGLDNDQKIEQSTSSTDASEESQSSSSNDEEAKSRTESQNSNSSEQDVQSVDTNNQVEKRNEEVEENVKQLREDKGEAVTENDEQKENSNVQDEIQETEKAKTEKKRKKAKAKEKEKEKKAWSTQADESEGEKEREKSEAASGGSEEVVKELEWHVCNVTAGADFIPCLDNEKYLKHSPRKHYEHRERHCPEDAPTCLVQLPKGYKSPIHWPSSRDKIWYHNVPHTKLAEVKGHQNWVKLTGEFLTFPGGGTQFIHGALHYIDFLQQAEPSIGWGKHTRVILDVGCGVGSFGGFLFERDVIAMSLAPKDEHEAQVQFALERGIPAISAVMGTQRLQFPGRVFDLVHCARCRVPWHADGGLLLLELNRLLRPGGFFVWSATPVYQTLEEDVEIWKQMTSLTKAMCWELVTIKKDALNQIGAAFFRKPTSNECYEQREQNQPPMCKDDDDPNAAWYVPLQACLHKLPVDKSERGAKWPEVWPSRVNKAPYWLSNSEVGIYGKPASQDFEADSERWKNVADELTNIGVTWSNVRNVMDMRAVYGGFGAALKELQIWVFNVVSTDAPDTLPIIYERGLVGIYHDWCESFSTYPRTYDLLHADHLFSKLKNRCNLVPVIVEVDRILRPGGNLIVRDESNVISEVENLLKSMHWEIFKDQEGVFCAKKGTWRPNSSVQLF